MKKVLSILLVLALAFSLVPAARGAEVRPGTQPFTLDGKAVSCAAYNIDGYNYVMLRGLANVLNGTAKQFSVTWDEATATVTLESGKPYQDDGAVWNGPAVIVDEKGLVTSPVVKSAQSLVIDGKAVTSVEAYNIGGNNYFKLADLRPYLGYGLSYDAASRTVAISTTSTGDLSLVAAASYDDVLAQLNRASASYAAGGGGDLMVDVPMATEEAVEAEVPAAAPTATADSASARNADTTAEEGADWSGTNVQVAGIDEGDVVKTDGTYLYILRGSKLILAQADGRDTKVLSDTKVGVNRSDKNSWKNKDPRELYISGDRVAVLSGCSESSEDSSGRWAYREYTAVDLYDVSDPAHPKQIVSLGQDGWDMGSRLKDGTLYLVTNHYVRNYDEEAPVTFVPALYRNGEAVPMAAGDVWLCPETDSTRYVVVTAYDLAAGKTAGSQTILGGGDTLYMSRDSIYVANSYYKETASAPRTESVYTVVDHSNRAVTDLVRFDLAGGLTVAANGTVPGQLDDQFSMDEYEGCLRLVTTNAGYDYTVYIDKSMGFTNHKWGEDQEETNGLYILDSSLNLLGKVDDLAPGERIYSARFDGEIAYFCTFRNVDPLFAVDVSDPAAPKVLSALKISGFSDYLHPWADGLLLGAGYEADEDTGWSEEIKLVMFDTSDKTNVTAKSVKITDLDYSEAMDNHKAFLISRDKNLIAFPADDQYVVFGYDEAKGFYQRATVDLGKWSWDARGMFIGDLLYVVGPDAIHVIDMNGFQTVTTVKLPVVQEPLVEEAIAR